MVRAHVLMLVLMSPRSLLLLRWRLVGVVLTVLLGLNDGGVAMLAAAVVLMKVVGCASAARRKCPRVIDPDPLEDFVHPAFFVLACFQKKIYIRVLSPTVAPRPSEPFLIEASRLAAARMPQLPTPAYAASAR